MINYWWVTRPKRKLNSIPEILAVFSTVSLDVQWQGSISLHRMFEDGLEEAGLKRIGERRDARGSGGRTYYAWLASLGLVFTQESTNKSYLTLAGEAIMQGRSPVEVLKNQVLKYQFPSPFSISPQSSKTRVNERFKIRPFRFLLRLLSDERVQYLTNDEIGKIIIVEAENETEQCYEHIVKRLQMYRDFADGILDDDYFEKYAPSSGKVNPDHPFSHLTDTANTLVNWLDFTQLVYREEGGIVKLLDEKREEVKYILENRTAFIDRPEEQEYFQRKYGLDPWHQKDTRNLANTRTITSRMIDIQKIRQAFITYSIHKPVRAITSDVIDYVISVTGTDGRLVENTLIEAYPNGAISGFMTEYFEMAFKGTEEAIQFEEATTELFSEVFGFKAKHLGQTGSKSAPDVLLLSDDAGYQAIIDNKAYSRYSISGDHHNRMVHNYLNNISNYSEYQQPIGFFTYISGGFGNQIDRQIQSIAEESGIHGSGMSVSNMIKLVEKQNEKPLTHQMIREIFSVDRQILLSDLNLV
ncbi:AlwI family type II restriction endonuclease [Anaerosacchariphilus polymeriproducens]|uniref:Restriction endonuclease n=1 Tax=Anaerosacchariphilus polymeriproducens TaxID=1812858 RepID=A0A371AUI5_9FIRM|nr:AlwI family type II restriction endonuclease [Anaerosacchariphilus polymeriproducens]RDU23236.1 restriction endonuclease [Anaerosacchariphilus polymeriproducens]